MCECVYVRAWACISDAETESQAYTVTWSPYTYIYIMCVCVLVVLVLFFCAGLAGTQGGGGIVRWEQIAQAKQERGRERKGWIYGTERYF